jgi:uncharacterized protein YodC (DUF2158 family)
VANTFNVGDVVELKSGGPGMTVAENMPPDYTRVKCQWFGGRKLESGFFPVASVKMSVADE